MIFQNRLILIGTALFFSLGGIYWGVSVRPYLWIEEGHIEAASLPVKSSEKGILTKVYPQEGEFVAQGAPLFTLENFQLKEKIQINQKALTGLRNEEILYKNQSEAAMQNYLADLGVRSQQETDQHLQKLQAAQLKANQIQEQIDLLAKEQARLQQQEAAISVLSPRPGIIAKQNKMPGESLQPGDSVLLLFDMSSCWVEAAISEKDLHAIEIGRPVDVYVAAYPGQVWQGIISGIGSTTLSKMQDLPPKPGQEKIAVKIALASKANMLIKPGLSAKIRIHR